MEAQGQLGGLSARDAKGSGNGKHALSAEEAAALGTLASSARVPGSR